MTQHMRISQETADRLFVKLQGLYAILPEDEQLLLQATVERAQENNDDVAGFVTGDDGGCIPLFPFPKFPTFPPPLDPLTGSSTARIR